MITINLKPGAKRAKAGPTFAGSLSALKELPGKIKDPWPIAAISAWVLTVAFLGWVWLGSASKTNRLETELTAKRAENHRFRALIAERRKAQSARDSVIAQIATIRAVDGDRYVWPHILDEVTRALPAYTWLNDIAPMGVPVDTSAAQATVAVQIIGRTMDMQGFTRFMRQMEDSPWLRDVTVVSTSTEIDHSRAVTAFVVKATYVRQLPHGRSETNGEN